METIHERVNLFLTALRSDDVSKEEGLDPNDSAFHIITEIFSTGNCGNLAVMLNLAFGGYPFVLPDKSHVITLIDGRFYDIHGDVTDEYKGHPKTAITRDQIIKCDPHMMYGNYSFDLRSPIV